MEEFIVDEDFHPDVRGYRELVRCKNCKWRRTNACFCKSKDDVQDDWYCSEEERE